MNASRPTVYLAGPAVFEENPSDIFDVMKQICAKYAMEGTSPFDGQKGFETLEPGPDLLTKIVAADIELMKRVDCGVFCFDGFRRSPEMDPGTSFEIGYMHALGKPLAGWTRDRRLYTDRVRDYFAEAFDQRLADDRGDGKTPRSGALRDPDGVLVHSEGLYQNAMTNIGVQFGGGQVYANATWTAAFEEAIADLSQRLSRPRREGRDLATF